MMTTIFSAALLAALWAQTKSTTPAETADEKEAAAARLVYMKQSASVYEARLDGEKKALLKLLPEPALRWNNPVSSVPDGTLFLWVRADGRPEMVGQVFIAAGSKDLWLHEFQSLSLDTFSVVRDGAAQWRPRRPGMELKLVEGAPSPAETAVQRLTQMRTIAQDFEAADDFEGKSRWQLRLMSKPLARYGKPGTDILDGALFVFAHGTDPEVFLVLEARNLEGKPRWHYGLAPMTAYALRASYKGQVVWNRPEVKPPFDRTAPYFIQRYVE